MCTPEEYHDDSLSFIFTNHFVRYDVKLSLITIAVEIRKNTMVVSKGLRLIAVLCVSIPTYANAVFTYIITKAPVSSVYVHL